MGRLLLFGQRSTPAEHSDVVIDDPDLAAALAATAAHYEQLNGYGRRYMLADLRHRYPTGGGSSSPDRTSTPSATIRSRPTRANAVRDDDTRGVDTPRPPPSKAAYPRAAAAAASVERYTATTHWRGRPRGLQRPRRGHPWPKPRQLKPPETQRGRPGWAGPCTLKTCGGDWEGARAIPTHAPDASSPRRRPAPRTLDRPLRKDPTCPAGPRAGAQSSPTADPITTTDTVDIQPKKVDAAAAPRPQMGELPRASGQRMALATVLPVTPSSSAIASGEWPLSRMLAALRGIRW